MEGKMPVGRGPKRTCDHPAMIFCNEADRRRLSVTVRKSKGHFHKHSPLILLPFNVIFSLVL